MRVILRRIVAKAFPELKRLDIAIDFGELDPDDCFFYHVERGRYIITVSDSFRQASRPVLEGGIAHELSHILHDSRVAPMQRELAFARYSRLVAYKRRDEQDADIRQIQRGYGGQLLAFFGHARSLGYRFKRENGLTRAEISRAVRTITRL